MGLRPSNALWDFLLLEIQTDALGYPIRSEGLQVGYLGQEIGEPAQARQ